MFFGLTIEKLLVIGVIAALLIGPERLPRYAETLAHLTTRTRDFLRNAKTRVQDEMGEEFEDVDWRTLDPRRYDPRRIIREALLDDAPVPTVRAASAGAAIEATGTPPPPPGAIRGFAPNETPPFDGEAT
ncbi:Sec-independent protein translocase TatB [Microbacterium sp. 4R-513]|uniref:Sec-independent protein translocase TatB n=1 Tax=Microbacterium sp. 4R-513 TaxID=2567934 RepID=UPI0013E1C701|nr:Sec-independent protein translocase TatB [Microbacterium sp. 4R-513]QIG40296.1 Sec-independent protein translocase TatB [Microbacterium sp. 4R-513]